MPNLCRFKPSLEPFTAEASSWGLHNDKANTDEAP